MDLRKFAAGCTAALAAVLISTAAAAQIPTTRHETNSSREARIQRTIKDTYTHRWEVFGGGAYMRFRSGEYTQNASVSPSK